MELDEAARACLKCYDHNPFMQLCGIEIAQLSRGNAVVMVQTDPLKHGNTKDYVHGGLLMTLMDNAAGLAGATLGKKVVTVSLTTDFIKAMKAGCLLQASASLVQERGKKLYMQLRVADAATEELLALASSIMLVVE